MSESTRWDDDAPTSVCCCTWSPVGSLKLLGHYVSSLLCKVPSAAAGGYKRTKKENKNWKNVEPKGWGKGDKEKNVGNNNEYRKNKERESCLGRIRSIKGCTWVRRGWDFYFVLLWHKCLNAWVT